MQNEIHNTQETIPATQTSHCEATNTVKCLNCGTEFEGNFCPECGQKAETGRFTMKFIFQNLLTAIFSNDGGIWYTLKNLFSRPGAMVVEILNGKRRRYFSPFPMLFFALTVYILIYTFTGSRGELQAIGQEYLEAEKKVNVEINDNNRESIADVTKIKTIFGQSVKFYYTHYTIITILTLPFFLFATRAWYGKANRKRYFRAEYLIAITYSMVMVVLYRCLQSLAFLLSESTADTMANCIPYVTVVAFAACFRKMLGFGVAKTVWRSILAIGLYYTILGFALLVVGIAVIAILFKDRIAAAL